MFLKHEMYVSVTIKNPTTLKCMFYIKEFRKFIIQFLFWIVVNTGTYTVVVNQSTELTPVRAPVVLSEHRKSMSCLSHTFLFAILALLNCTQCRGVKIKYGTKYRFDVICSCRLSIRTPRNN